MCSSGVVKQNKLYFSVPIVFLNFFKQNYLILFYFHGHKLEYTTFFFIAIIVLHINGGKGKERKEMFYLTTHSTHLRLYGVRHMVKDHSDSERGEETRCRHMGYSFRLAARVLLYASSHRQDNTYHSLSYASRGALAGMRNSLIGRPHEGSIRRPIARSCHGATSRSFMDTYLIIQRFYRNVCFTREDVII